MFGGAEHAGMKRWSPWVLVAILAGTLLVEEWRLRGSGRTPERLVAASGVDPAPVQPVPSVSRGSATSGKADHQGREEAAGSPAPGERAAPAESTEDLAREWLTRFRERPADRAHAQKVAGELIADLPPDLAWAVMEEIWEELTEVHRGAVLAPFVRSGHVHVLGILDLAATAQLLRLLR